MSILIKGINMPTSCPCELIGDGYDVYCSFAGGVPRYIKEYDECCQNGTRPSWCPLIELPPHGRLIDADALAMSDHMVGKLMMFGGEYVYTQSEIDNAPTIIEAEEGEI